MGKIAAEKLGSIENFKKDLKARPPGSAAWIKNVNADGIKVRFLHGPEEWVGFSEYWAQDIQRMVPMENGEVLPDGVFAKKRYLAAAVDIDSDEVVPLRIVKSLANDLLEIASITGTITDRDFNLVRLGTTMKDTTYKALADAPTERNLDKYETLDLIETLVTARNDALGLSNPDPFSADDTDTEDDEAAPAAPAEVTAPTMEQVLTMDRDELEAAAKGMGIAFSEGAKRGELMSLLVEAVER